MPQKKWNLQDIRPAGSKRKQISSKPIMEVEEVAVQTSKQSAPMGEMPVRRQASEEIDPDIASIEVVDGKSARTKRTILTIVLATIIIAVAIGANMLLGGAEVKIEPRSKEISVQSEFTASISPKTDTLGYELLSLESVAEKQVKATGIEEVSDHATGKVFVYNTANPSPQRLITNTRFESPDGLIFRIKDSIEVPGITKDADGNVIPGQVVAEVFADGPGEQYNIGPARFTVPGLKGTAQFDTIYAESTSGFEGGFEGERYIIEESELQIAQQELHTQLRNELLEQLQNQIPNGFVVYQDSVTFTFESLPATEYGNELATIKEKARLHVPMFLESEYASYLAELSIPDYKGESVFIENPHTITFTYNDELTYQTDISTLEELEFTLKGITTLVWEFDPEKLKADLAGRKDKETAQVFATYPAIEHATTELRPFWSSTFPENTDNIVITTVVE